jgi:regulator of sirC expression with transglutaminase-like and TPR domain
MDKKLLLSIIILFTVTVTYSQNIDREKILIYNNEGKIDFIESYLNLCLLIDSTIDKKQYYKEINLMCNEVQKEISGYQSPQELIEKINNYLFHKKGFKYNSTANKFFSGTKSERDELINKGISRVEFDLMPRVLKNREGICSSLSMLYLTFAFKLKLPIFGIIVPDHFFVRYNDNSSKINIETTYFGAQYSDSHYIEKYIGKKIKAISIYMI